MLFGSWASWVIKQGRVLLYIINQYKNEGKSINFLTMQESKIYNSHSFTCYIYILIYMCVCIPRELSN